LSAFILTKFAFRTVQFGPKEAPVCLKVGTVRTVPLPAERGRAQAVTGICLPNQPVIDLLSFAPVEHQSGSAHYCQMLRCGRLGDAEPPGNFAYGQRPSCQKFQNLLPGFGAEDTEQPGPSPTMMRTESATEHQPSVGAPAPAVNKL